LRYGLRFTKKAQKQFNALEVYTQKRICDYLNKHVHGCENPRATGKRLSENMSDYWRYRIGDYRVIREIQDDSFVVLAVKVGHRSKAYD